MVVILSYAPRIGIELLRLDNGKEILKSKNWLNTLIAKYTDDTIYFIGRDDIKRVEIKMDMNVFQKIRNDEMFLLQAEFLRRIRTEYNGGVLDYLINSRYAIIDNDLDKITT